MPTLMLTKEVELTVTEKRVYQHLVTDDVSIVELATVLKCSEATARNWAQMIYLKKGVGGRVGLLIQENARLRKEVEDAREEARTVNRCT